MPDEPIGPDEVARYREEFPVTRRCAYLNHAGLSPTSTRVVEAVAGWARSVAEGGLRDLDAWVEQETLCRARSARLLGCSPEEVAFVRNTSHGLALVAEGIAWRPGDRVAVATSVEYPSNVYVWQHLAERGVEVVEIPAAADGAVTAEAVAGVLDARVRAVAVSSAQYASGAVTDVAGLGLLCRQQGALLCVDGIQSLGALPVDVGADGVDTLAADSHKWMLGLAGIGVLYVERSLCPRLRPALVGWKSTEDAWDFDAARFDLLPTAARFEEGSSAFGLIAGMGAAIGLLLEVGVERIAARIEGLVARLAGDLAELGCVVGPAPGRRRHFLTFTHPALAPEQVEAALASADVVASVRRGRVRISPHFYTQEEEVDRVAAAVRRLL